MSSSKNKSKFEAIAAVSQTSATPYRSTEERCGKAFQALTLAVNHYVMTSDVIGESTFVRADGRVSLIINMNELEMYKNNFAALRNVVTSLHDALNVDLEQIMPRPGSDDHLALPIAMEMWYLHLPYSEQVAELLAERLVASAPNDADCYPSAQLAWQSFQNTPSDQEWEMQGCGVACFSGAGKPLEDTLGAIQYPSMVASGRPLSWILDKKNWDSLPSDEQQYLIASGSAPLRTFEYMGSPVMAGMWFGSLVFDLRTLAIPLALQEIADVPDEHAVVDFDQLVWRAGACSSNTWYEFASWVGSIMAEFDPLLHKSEKRKWRLRKGKRN